MGISSYTWPSSVERYSTILLCARHSTEMCIHTPGKRGYVFFYVQPRYEAQGTSRLVRYMEVYVTANYVIVSQFSMELMLFRRGLNKRTLAWLRNVNIAILVSHVSWNVLTSSTLFAQPCICTIALNGHARISNLHCQFLCCCALLQVKISLKTHPSHYLSQFVSFTPTKSK